jgi:argininosuccinate lyase
MKIWEKGFSVNDKIEQFTVGQDRELDMYLAPFDMLASKAQAKMLASIGLISKEEEGQLLTGLDELLAQVENGTFQIEADFEDVHSKIEYYLTEKFGDAGKKIHTARSRNDHSAIYQGLHRENQRQGFGAGATAVAAGREIQK